MTQVKIKDKITQVNILELCSLLGIKTQGELRKFKDVSGAKTNYDLMCELEKVAIEAHNG